MWHVSQRDLYELSPVLSDNLTGSQSNNNISLLTLHPSRSESRMWRRYYESIISTYDFRLTQYSCLFFKTKVLARPELTE